MKLGRWVACSLVALAVATPRTAHAGEPPYDASGPYARVRHPGPYKPTAFQRTVIKS
jgi:hypothetical protein